ncbi:hypothetical protein EMIHUDRAFT_210628 [Emiliania huxleyi CCMP1516]|uniref:F-box domain-containing protein n=2 Tax=Emiliania huxleyi TaxID=2903 RepID=A0A0D3IYF3_EMIH1|nr:hypothetical protein EMIHUDRAFT_210628 [Emiliania huxleyi CCMP1516]EOD16288.1 hypothetical protein EMIHUDRAFT_210628 [Emiliania huxleyi CCMP1516]|eukprot:XP_005768717.1 hypothetical protein EMIHUDRAFT_210628 [Emiliania huxleyi CCMP1516]
MPLRLDELPLELLVLTLRALSAQQLCCCDATCKALHAAARDESLWRSLCEQQWPSGPNLSSCRASFSSANGFAHLRRLPRRVIDVVERKDGPGRRAGQRDVPAQVTSVDADATRLVASLNAKGGAYGEVVCLSRTGVRRWSLQLGRLLKDVRIVGEHVLALHADTDWEPKLAVVGANGALRGQLCSLPAASAGAVPAGWGSYHGLAVPPSQPDTALAYSVSGCWCAVDLPTGATLLHADAGHLGSPDAEHYSLCADPLHPHLATAAWRAGARSWLGRVDVRCGAGLQAALLCTRHSGLLRVGAGREHRVLTSHARCKEIEPSLTVGFSSSHDSEHARSSQPRVEAWRCAGNGPDFDFNDGVLAAVSAGAPGTSFGAKLHVFADAPRRITADVPLSEIVIDDSYRHTCPRGIRVGGGTISLIADRRRAIQCLVAETSVESVRL